MVPTIIFLHGFFASGACVPAVTFKECLSGKARVLTPDLPLHPREALDFIIGLCAEVSPCLLAGNSNGAFFAQIVASRLSVPALLGNPHFEMTRFLSERIGRQEYKSPRADGRSEFVIDRQLIDEFAGLQSHQWDYCQPADRGRVWGVFGDNDHIARYKSLFLEHYDHAFSFPGGHTPTADEVRQYYVPLAERLAGM